MFCSYVLILYSVIIFRICSMLLYVDIFCSYITQLCFVAISCSYTGCPRRNVPDFGRVFLMLKYTDITKTPMSKVERLRR